MKVPNLQLRLQMILSFFIIIGRYSHATAHMDRRIHLILMARNIINLDTNPNAIAFNNHRDISQRHNSIFLESHKQQGQCFQSVSSSYVSAPLSLYK